jgi:hypothetical protein
MERSIMTGWNSIVVSARSESAADCPPSTICLEAMSGRPSLLIALKPNEKTIETVRRRVI